MRVQGPAGAFVQLTRLAAHQPRGFIDVARGATFFGAAGQVASLTIALGQRAGLRAETELEVPYSVPPAFSQDLVVLSVTLQAGEDDDFDGGDSCPFPMAAQCSLSYGGRVFTGPDFSPSLRDVYATLGPPFLS